MCMVNASHKTSNAFHVLKLLEVTFLYKTKLQGTAPLPTASEIHWGYINIFIFLSAQLL